MHAEDHQGGDDAPAEVTRVQPSERAIAARDEWLEKMKRLPGMVRDNPAIAERLARGSAPEPVEGVAVCDAKLEYCVCSLAAGHEGPHVCGRDDGSWEYGDDGELRIVAFPDVLKALGYKQ